MTLKAAPFKQPERVNADRLKEELREAFGDRFDSVDTGIKFTNDPAEKPSVVVRVIDPSVADGEIIEQVLAAHNPDVLSEGQQRMKDRADSHKAFIAADFAIIRAMPKSQRDEVVIDLLEHIQKLMRGAE